MILVAAAGAAAHAHRPFEDDDDDDERPIGDPDDDDDGDADEDDDDEDEEPMQLLGGRWSGASKRTPPVRSARTPARGLQAMAGVARARVMDATRGISMRSDG